VTQRDALWHRATTVVETYRIALEIDELQHQTAIADTLAYHLQRLTQVYFAVKPLLSVVAALPQPWRAALTLFLGTLDAVATSSERFTAIEAQS
jgi:hypothetical protein